MILQYPNLLDRWEKEQIDSFEQEAVRYACGDKEIETQTLNSMIGSLDNDIDLKNLFYQSMLLMVIAFYDSVVALFAKRTNTAEHIKAICKKKNIILSTDASNCVNIFDTDVNTLRNNVCHNNFGTPRKTDVLQQLARTYPEIQYADGIVSITGPNYILEVLDKVTKTLIELANKLGYQHRTYKKDNSTNI